MSGRSRREQQKHKYAAKDVKNIIDSKWSHQWAKICYMVDYNSKDKTSPEWLTEHDIQQKDLYSLAWDQLILNIKGCPYQNHQDLVRTKQKMEGQYFHAEMYFDVDDSMHYLHRISHHVILPRYYFRGHPLKQMIEIPLGKYNKEMATDFKLSNVCCICVHIFTYFCIFCIIVF